MNGEQRFHDDGKTRWLSDGLWRLWMLAAWIALCQAAAIVTAAETDAGEAETCTLRYRFSPGETVCWRVMHRGQITATVSGTTEQTRMWSESLKLWRIEEVKPDGTATFVYSVDDVQMRQHLPGKSEVSYDSRSDKKAPPGFEDVAKAAGKPLARITIDPRGKVLAREKIIDSPFEQNRGQLTIPLPEKPIGVGQSWSEPHELVVPLESGGARRVQTLQRYTLKRVKTGVATILVETQILTPVDHPALEAKLIQQASRGKVRFDVEAGRIISQQIDLDKRVVGFRGAASSLHYLTRFSEKLIESPQGAIGNRAVSQKGRRS